MNNEPILQAFSIFQTSKEERSDFVADIVQRIRDGEADALQIHLQVKNMEQIITMLTSTDEKKNKASLSEAIEYKKLVLESAEKHGKSFTLHNASFKITEVGTKYDWDACGDPVMSGLIQMLDALSAQVKERQEFLKTLPEAGLPMVDLESGESYNIYRPSKSSTTSVTVTLK